MGDGFGLVGGLVQRLGDFLNVCHGAKVSVAEFCLIWIRKLIGYNRLVSIYRNFLVSLYYYAEVEMRFFETRFLKEVDTFFEQLDKKVVVKILYNIELAEHTKDQRLFKKLDDEIWEFRTRAFGLQVRLLAFWDKREKSSTLVIVSNGFVKKTQKIPKAEIDRALTLRSKYFDLS